MTQDWRNSGFGLYIHWPFCAAKCPYCDFNSHVRTGVDHQAWSDALVKDLQRQAQQVQDRTVDSIFFGGGTPSLMAPSTVQSIIDAGSKIWSFAPDIEITLEANPTSVEAGKFTDFKLAGINRVSMGIQALNDPDLKRLGRMHTKEEALAAFDIARAQFDRVSFDLIYARMDQTLAAWEKELDQALSLAVDHLSLYQLTIEQGTRFGEMYNLGRLKGLPPDDLSAQMYAVTHDVCADHGFNQYEVSNYARAQAQSKHNLIYWRYGDYLGIGPGAHGRISAGGQKRAVEAEKLPEKWLANPSCESVEIVSLVDQAIEYLMMSLRLSEGSNLRRYASLAGTPIDQSKIDRLQSQGMIRVIGDTIVATDDGRVLLNSVLTELLS